MCASHKLEMRKEAAQEMRSVMRKKLLITAAAIILSADFIAGGTMANIGLQHTPIKQYQHLQ